MVKFFGERQAVTSAREKVRRIFKDIKKKQDNPDYVRKHHGSKGVLQALLKEDPKVPIYWTKNTGVLSKILTKLSLSKSSTLVDVDTRTHRAVDLLVQGSWVQHFVGHGADSRGLTHSKIQVTKVQRIENPKIYREYRTGLNLACEEGMKADFSPITNAGEPEVLTATLKIPELESIRLPEVNEYFLFHGTKAETVEHIVLQGTDSRLGGSGLFGQGLYLAESSTKADQYAGKLYAYLYAFVNSKELHEVSGGMHLFLYTIFRPSYNCSYLRTA